MNSNIISTGAEAVISKEGDEIVKNRISKSYRISELDEKIRKQRSKSEAKLLMKASSIISAPKPTYDSSNKFKISMPFINGEKLADNLDMYDKEKQIRIINEVGKNVAKLHDSNIIHGDLTTSNMILQNEEVYLIDFGLGFISTKIEDRAVDIHLLKQALESKHHENWEVLLESFFKGYALSKDYSKTLERFKKVETRGRYKEQY